MLLPITLLTIAFNLPLSLAELTTISSQLVIPGQPLSPRHNYARAHHYPRDYIFGSEWEELPSRSFNSSSSSPSKGEGDERRSRRSKSEGSWRAARDIVGDLTDSIAELTKGMFGKGSTTPVTITWYTGYDLQNPSCWANGDWAPSDDSFVSALTLTGWTTKPKCFQFLELCNENNVCTFVRVVDTCAGCAKGSKHVDLTQAAFKTMADLDTGILTVKMRGATNPSEWSEDIWGPRH